MRGQIREWVRKETLLDMVTNWMWVRGRKARDDPQVSDLETVVASLRRFGEDPIHWGPLSVRPRRGEVGVRWGEGMGHLLLQAPTISQALVSRCFMFVVQLLSHAQLFATPWTMVRQAQLSMGFPRPGGGMLSGAQSHGRPAGRWLCTAALSLFLQDQRWGDHI